MQSLTRMRNGLSRLLLLDVDLLKALILLFLLLLLLLFIPPRLLLRLHLRRRLNVTLPVLISADFRFFHEDSQMVTTNHAIIPGEVVVAVVAAEEEE